MFDFDDLEEQEETTTAPPPVAEAVWMEMEMAGCRRETSLKGRGTGGNAQKNRDFLWFLFCGCESLEGNSQMVFLVGCNCLEGDGFESGEFGSV